VFPTAVYIPKQQENNGHKCGKRSPANTGNYYVRYAVSTSDNMQCTGRNNFEFTFQLMTVTLLNTKGFQNLKYCIRNKGFLEHLEAFLYPTAGAEPDIFIWGGQFCNKGSCQWFV